MFSARFLALLTALLFSLGAPSVASAMDDDLPSMWHSRKKKKQKKRKIRRHRKARDRRTTKVPEMDPRHGGALAVMVLGGAYLVWRQRESQQTAN